MTDIDKKLAEFQKEIDQDLKKQAEELLKALEFGQKAGFWDNISKSKRMSMVDKLNQLCPDEYLSKKDRDKWNDLLVSLLRNN